MINKTPIDEKILNHVKSNRFSIVMHSENIDMHNSIALYLLHYMSLNQNKVIYLTSTKYISCTTISERLKNLFYFYRDVLDVKVTRDTLRILELSNGCQLNLLKSHKNVVVTGANGKITGGYVLKRDIDLIIFMDMAHDFECEVKPIYSHIFPNVMAIPDSKIIITSSISLSCPNNHFYDLFKKSELPEGDPNKTLYEPLRLYYWMVDGIDEKFVTEKIKELGEIKFNERYNFCIKYK